MSIQVRLNWTSGKVVNYRYNMQECTVFYDCCAGAYNGYSIEPETGEFELIINSDPEDGGTTTGAGDYEAFSEVTVVATPESGFDFVGWYDQWGNLLSSDDSFAFTLIQNTILTARFEAV